MQLTYNPSLKRYEFRCTHTERDGADGKTGALGLALATSARFQTAFYGRDPLFHTADPFKAQQLSRFGDDDLRQRIAAHITEKGGAVPVLTHRNGVYIWSGPIEANGVLYREIPKRAGFAFTKTPYLSLPRKVGTGLDEPVWWTEQSVKAMKCADYADEPARLAIGTYMSRRHAALEASRAEDADIDIPYPDNGMTPFGYQRAGVAYAKPRTRVLFGDEMGLGKTIEAILWTNLVTEKLDRTLRTLVVCPASLKRNWMRELEQWLYRPATLGIADTRYTQVVPKTDVVIINYEMLSRKVDTGRRKMVKDSKSGEKRQKIVYEHFLRDALKGKWDMLIVDECHKLKGNPTEVIRSRMAFSIEADRMAFLSGTPMVNRPRELWNLAHHLAPKQFPDKAAFMERYCKGGSFYDPYGGGTNLGELQERLRLYIMVRRLKRDVLKDLPPKLRQVIELPAAGCEGLVKDEMLAFTRKEEILISMRLRVELAKASEHPEDYKKAVATLTAGIKVAFEELSRIRRETAVAKIPVVIDHLKECFESTAKIILFVHHKEVAHAIALQLEVHLNANATQESYRQNLRQVDGDRSSARTRVHQREHLGNQLEGERHQAQRDSGRTGTTYPQFKGEGRSVVVITGDTSLPERDIAVQRFQQDDTIRLFIGSIGAAGVGLTLTASSYVVFAELDWVPGNVTQAEDRAHRIGQKDSVLVQHLVLEGSLDKRMADVIVEKQDMADRALDRESADELMAEPVVPTREAVATQGVSPAAVAKLAEKMTRADIAAVHLAMQMLAGTHKDSGILDGATFRAVDAPLGMIFAKQKTLTPRMAALGKRFLSRPEYKKQLGHVPEIAKLYERGEKA